MNGSKWAPRRAGAPRRRPDPAQKRAQGALLLSLCAGMVDAVGTLSLGRVLLANMSGNTMRAAISGVDGLWREALHYLWPMAGFFLGLTMTGLLHETRERRHARWVWLVLFGEAALLLGVVLLSRMHDVPPVLLVVLGATAMGMQNASLRRAAGASIFTTHVTGTLTKLSEESLRFLFSMMDWHGADPPRTWRQWCQRFSQEESFRVARLMFELWGLFLVGALLGAALDRRYGINALLVPSGLVTLVAFAARMWPLEPHDSAFHRRPDGAR